MNINNNLAYKWINYSERYFTFSTFSIFPNGDLYGNAYHQILLANDYINFFTYKWSKLIKSFHSSDFLVKLNQLNKLNNTSYLPFEGEFRKPIGVSPLKTLQQLSCYQCTSFFFKNINDAFVLTHHKNRKTFKKDLTELINKGYTYIKQVKNGSYKGKYYYIILDPKGNIINK